LKESSFWGEALSDALLQLIDNASNLRGFIGGDCGTKVSAGGGLAGSSPKRLGRKNALIAHPHSVESVETALTRRALEQLRIPIVQVTVVQPSVVCKRMFNDTSFAHRKFARERIEWE
jgi:hypothetical protein